ncbi:MAG: amidohydrolase family protein [Bacteroidales bacterium]
MKNTLLFALVFATALSGCGKKYYHEKDYRLVKKIDSHVHINTADDVFESVADSDNFVLITLNVDHSDSASVGQQFNYAYGSANRHPGKVFFGPAFYFDTTGWGTPLWSARVIDQLEKKIVPGVVTVKIWKNIGMTVRDREGKFIMADDEALKPVYEFIHSKKLALTAHLGEPRNCWLPLEKMTVRSDSSYFARHPEYHMYLHPEYPSYEQQIQARDNILKNIPGLTFIGCHLGSLEWNVDSLAARLDKFPDFAVDMSARICHLQYQSAKDRKRVRDFIIKYQDRLLYGTDVGYEGGNATAFKKRMHATWQDDWKYFCTDEVMTSDKFDGNFRGLKLPAAVIDKIYYLNACKWYAIK